MTSDIKHSPAAADYQQAIRVQASPDAVFDAITTVSGLAAWWTPVTGSGGTGGELRFMMGSPDPLVIKVEQATRPAHVQWAVMECDFLADWVGTRPAFTITAAGAGASEVRFRHHGLTPELECFAMCANGWNHYLLASLRDYVETGVGSPRGSEADTGRRAQEAGR